MSHELRTPLNSLLILSKMLAENRDGNLTAEQVKFAQTVYTSGNDLLRSSTRSSTSRRSRPARCRSTRSTFALARGARLPRADVPARRRAEGARRSRSRWTPDLPATIFTDVNRLQQILKNLLSNAFKFTAKGGVTLTVQREPRDRGEDMLSLRRAGHRHRHSRRQAEAHLRGVPAGRRHDEPQVRRHRARPHDQPRDRAAARRVDRGRERARTQGSTFTLYLPASYAGAEARARRRRRAVTSDARAAGPAAARRTPSFAGTKVLARRRRRAQHLRHRSDPRGAQDIDVLHAENGKVALELLQQHPDVDLVLMDTMMPEMDGLAATRAIRDIVQFRSLPIISLTAKAMKGDREKALEAGASDYVDQAGRPRAAARGHPPLAERRRLAEHARLAGRDDHGSRRRESRRSRQRAARRRHAREPHRPRGRAQAAGGRARRGALGRRGARAGRCSSSFAVVLLDVQMPEMDGFEVARAHPRRPSAGARCPSSS